MSKENVAPDISRAEYPILRVLWKYKKLSVREVHDYLDNGSAYSTTKTVMDRMVKKGFLQRGSFHGVFLYQPLISRPAGLVKMLKFFADSVMEIEYSAMVSMFAKNQSLTEEEIAELNELIESSDREQP